ncbi:MAG: 50S ribosomal protein L19 [Parcubacteria group bacterium]
MTDEQQTTTVESTTPVVAPVIDRDYPEVVPGVQVAVHQEITDFNSKGEEKKRIQIFEGMVLARKHGKGNQATITVRKESDGVGVERIFPLYLPTIKKIVVLKRFRVRRAKLNYTREAHKRLKEIK